MPVIVALVWLLFDIGVTRRDVLDDLLLESRLQRVIRALSNSSSGTLPHYSLIELCCCYDYGLCAWVASSRLRIISRPSAASVICASS